MSWIIKHPHFNFLNKRRRKKRYCSLHQSCFDKEVFPRSFTVKCLWFEGCRTHKVRRQQHAWKCAEINKRHHLAFAKPPHLQRWSPQRWPGAARQWSPCRRNLRLHDWTQSCCHLLLQNQARSSPTPDENQRTSSWCRSDGRGVFAALISGEQLVPCALNYCTDDDAGPTGNLNGPCINHLEHATMQ